MQENKLKLLRQKTQEISFSWMTKCFSDMTSILFVFVLHIVYTQYLPDPLCKNTYDTVSDDGWVWIYNVTVSTFNDGYVIFDLSTDQNALVRLSPVNGCQTIVGFECWEFVIDNGYNIFLLRDNDIIIRKRYGGVDVNDNWDDIVEESDFDLQLISVTTFWIRWSSIDNYVGIGLGTNITVNEIVSTEFTQLNVDINYLELGSYDHQAIYKVYNKCPTTLAPTNTLTPAPSFSPTIEQAVDCEQYLFVNESSVVVVKAFVFSTYYPNIGAEFVIYDLNNISLPVRSLILYNTNTLDVVKFSNNSNTLIMNIYDDSIQINREYTIEILTKQPHPNAFYIYRHCLTESPTLSPTPPPTSSPTPAPTLSPTSTPTVSPTLSPTSSPTLSPTVSPSPAPTLSPTPSPSSSPTPMPTLSPTPSPTVSPTSIPSITPPASAAKGLSDGLKENVVWVIIGGIFCLVFVSCFLFIAIYCWRKKNNKSIPNPSETEMCKPKSNDEIEIIYRENEINTQIQNDALIASEWQKQQFDIKHTTLGNIALKDIQTRKDNDLNSANMEIEGDNINNNINQNTDDNINNINKNVN